MSSEREAGIRTIERVTLTRDVRIYGPDGASVGRQETVTVDIVWLEGKPADDLSYREYGAWTLSTDPEPSP